MGRLFWAKAPPTFMEPLVERFVIFMFTASGRVRLIPCVSTSTPLTCALTKRLFFRNPMEMTFSPTDKGSSLKGMGKPLRVMRPRQFSGIVRAQLSSSPPKEVLVVKDLS